MVVPEADPTRRKKIIIKWNVVGSWEVIEGASALGRGARLVLTADGKWALTDAQGNRSGTYEMMSNVLILRGNGNAPRSEVRWFIHGLYPGHDLFMENSSGKVKCVHK